MCLVNDTDSSGVCMYIYIGWVRSMSAGVMYVGVGVCGCVCMWVWMYVGVQGGGLEGYFLL